MTVDRRRRWAAAVGVGLLFGLTLVLAGPATPASAHAVLTRSDPAPDTVVAIAPSRVTLTFSETVQLVPDKIQVLDPNNERADLGTPQVEGAVVTVPLRPDAPRGTYLISFRVISADSHPVTGAIVYSVGAPSARSTGGAVGIGPDPAVRWAIPVAKYLGYAGLVLLIGPVMVLALLWPHRLSRRGPARLGWTGLVLVSGSTVAGIWLQAPYTLGVGLFEVGLGDVQDVLGTTYGAVMLVRLGVLCAAAVLLRPLLRGSDTESRTDLALIGVLGVAALATWPLTGHPSSSPVAGVSVVVDALHLASMAVWLGGLVMLAAFLLPRANLRELGAILPIWSRWAAAAVSTLILAGTVQAIIEVGSFGGLVRTDYGRLVLLKVGLVALVIAVAAFARRTVRRVVDAEPVDADAEPADADAGADAEPVDAEPVDVGAGTADAQDAGRSGLRTLRRTVVVELAVTAVILGLTTVLVQIPPSRTAAAVESAAADATVISTLKNEYYSLQVEIAPGATGNNSVHLYAYGLDGKPLPVAEWFVTAALPADGIEPIDVNLLRITDNHVIGDIALPVPGEWVFRFTLRTSELDQSSVQLPVKVS